MSDPTDEPDADAATIPETENPAKDAEAPAARASSPAPRPRSAASRARRIGGAAAAPRQSDDAATGEAATGKAATGTGATGKSATGKSATGKSATGKVALSKGAPAADKGASDDSNGTGGSLSALTFSVPGWVRWAPGFAFAATAVVFLVLFAVARLGGDDAPASTSNTARQEVLAAAKTCLATLNTYRYTQLDQAEAAGVRCTTGKLTSDYKKTVSTVIRKNAPTLKAVQIAKINTAGIESVTKNGKQWTVLAYGQLNITTANQKQGRIDPFAVVARLQQVDGKWVLSKVDTVSSFSS